MIAGGYDHSRDGLADGCRSSMAPCPHQRRHPRTLCAHCEDRQEPSRRVGPDYAHCNGNPAADASDSEDAETRALLIELEQELGVKGPAAVFRKALALAKSARAELTE